MDASDNNGDLVATHQLVPSPPHSLSTTCHDVPAVSLSLSHVLFSKCLRKLTRLVGVYHLSCTIAVEVSSSTCISAPFPLFIPIHSVAAVHVDGEHCSDGIFLRI